VSLAACSSGTSGPSTAPGASASGAGLSAAESAKIETAAADEVLRRHGMTEQRFEELMYEIAEDEEMSEAYAKRVGG
jgi:hypothetical protein